MPRGRPTNNRNAGTPDTAAKPGFDAKLWQAADALRNNMDAAEYKHVVLGLIFLKYISDAFEAKHAELDAQRSEGADPEDPDEYRAENIFWVAAGSALVVSERRRAAADNWPDRR
jgi:type I restriction enzyme M protein